MPRKSFGFVGREPSVGEPGKKMAGKGDDGNREQKWLRWCSEPRGYTKAKKKGTDEKERRAAGNDGYGWPDGRSGKTIGERWQNARPFSARTERKGRQKRILAGMERMEAKRAKRKGWGLDGENWWFKRQRLECTARDGHPYGVPPGKNFRNGKRMEAPGQGRCGRARKGDARQGGEIWKNVGEGRAVMVLPATTQRKGKKGGTKGPSGEEGQKRGSRVFQEETGNDGRDGAPSWGWSQ